MPLEADIQALRDRTLAELVAAHDYFAETKIAWLIVEKVIGGGTTFSIENPVTGTLTIHTELQQRIPSYVKRELAEATFQQFIGIFENFFLDLLRLWLLAYPQSLGAKQVDFKTILDAPDKDAITLHIVTREVNEILYDRPAGWFAYLESKAKLGCPTPDEIDRISEAKASRDVLVHNRGIANKLYVFKAGKLARFADGERIEIPDPYHREVWALLCKVVADIGDAAVAKLS